MKKEEYTYADVIIDPNDERVMIGEKYYMGCTPNEVLESANEANYFFINTLIKIDNVKFWYPFEGVDQRLYCCLIKAKEPQDEYVPYDLSKKEVRDKLRGKWIVEKEEKREFCINNFDYRERNDNQWSVQDCFTGDYITPFGLLTCYTFLDGSPCGQKVEE